MKTVTVDQAIGLGRHVFQRNIRLILKECRDDRNGDISPRIHRLLTDMIAEMDEFNAPVAAFDAEIKVLVRMNPAMKRLTEIPGGGPMIASALVTVIGDGSAFAKG